MKIIEVENLGKKYQLATQGKIAGDLATLSEKIDLGKALTGLMSKRSSDENGKKDKSVPKLKKSFWALREVSFEVEAGTKLGIIGSNGAGKSTLLKILSRITPPSEGKAILRGRVASLLEVGTGFNPELTGRENVFLNGIILGMKRKEIKKRFDEIVDFAEVAGFIDQPYKHFSSGMSMRLAFSVAAFLDPEILIVDEVLAVGDLAFQKKSLSRMQIAAQKEGKTIIFVSHNLSAIENLCDLTLCLDKGKMVSIGKTKEIVREYSLGKIEQTGQGENQTEVNLVKHNQKKNIDLGLQKLKISVNGNDTNRVTVGDNVRLSFLVRHDKNRQNLSLSLSLKNPQGQSVINFDNGNYGWLWNFELNKKNGFFEEINVILPNLQLYGEGKFMFDVSLSYRNEIIDLLPDAFFIEVFPRDVWETGQLLNPMTNFFSTMVRYEQKKTQEENW